MLFASLFLPDLSVPQGGALLSRGWCHQCSMFRRSVGPRVGRLGSLLNSMVCQVFVPNEWAVVFK